MCQKNKKYLFIYMIKPIEEIENDIRDKIENVTIPKL